MANRTTKTRAQLKAYFKKYSSPTVQQWHDVLDAVLNLVDDLPIDEKDVKNLKDQIEAINKSIEETGEQQKNLKTEILDTIKTLKTNLEDAIAKKADTAEGGAGYVPHLAELKNDDPFPVGTIAQYIGATDYDRDLIRGFFYEKKEVETTEETPELTPGDPVSITELYANWNLDKKYIAKIQRHESKYNNFIYAPYNDKKESAICININALAVKPDLTKCYRRYTSAEESELYFPLIALSAKGEVLPYEVINEELFINGSKISQSGSITTCTIYEEETKQAYLFSTLMQTNGSWGVVIPLINTNIYPNVEFIDENLKVFPMITEEGSTWLKTGETLDFTPQFLQIGGSGDVHKIKWQIIQTSPTMM